MSGNRWGGEIVSSQVNSINKIFQKIKIISQRLIRNNFSSFKWSKLKIFCISGTSNPTALLDGVTTPAAGFGIRSYLHQFYQSPAVEDIESAGAW